MKTHKVLLLTIVVSVALSLSAQAGNNRGNNGSQAAHGTARAGAPALHSAPGFRFNGGRMITPSQRFSSVGMRSMPASFRQRSIYSSGNAPVGQHQPTTRTFGGGNVPARFENNRARDFGIIGNNRKNRTGSVENGNSRGLADGNNHVFARRSAGWHRNWDRRCDHWWRGHRCRFVNGSWFIFDFGFIPWYGYPSDYYGYNYYDPYPYGYDPGVYEGVDPNYYGQGTYDSSDQSTDSTVAAAQERLAREGYYRGEIDGVFGPETRRAIMRYQSDRGLRVTGYLTEDTRQSLGLRRTTGY
jgi:hypothetical protein